MTNFLQRCNFATLDTCPESPLPLNYDLRRLPYLKGVGLPWCMPVLFSDASRTDPVLSIAHALAS